MDAPDDPGYDPAIDYVSLETLADELDEETLAWLRSQHHEATIDRQRLQELLDMRAIELRRQQGEEP